MHCFSDPAFGLDDVHWFLFWPLVLDCIQTLDAPLSQSPRLTPSAAPGVGFGLISEAPGLGCYWIGFGDVQLGLVLDWF